MASVERHQWFEAALPTPAVASLCVEGQLGHPFFCTRGAPTTNRDFSFVSRWLSTSFRSDACAVRAILAGDNSVDQCPAAGRPTRLHLTRAKELARGMAIIQDVDTYEADATLLCQLLKWPSSACRPSAFTPGGKASTKHHTQVMRCTCMQPCLAPQWCWPVITRVCRMHCRSTPTS